MYVFYKLFVSAVASLFLVTDMMYILRLLQGDASNNYHHNLSVLESCLLCTEIRSTYSYTCAIQIEASDMRIIFQALDNG